MFDELILCHQFTTISKRAKIILKSCNNGGINYNCFAFMLLSRARPSLPNMQLYKGWNIQNRVIPLIFSIAENYTENKIFAPRPALLSSLECKTFSSKNRIEVRDHLLWISEWYWAFIDYSLLRSSQK